MGRVDLIKDLEKLLKPDQVSISESVREGHSHDESYHRGGQPDVVVFPESTDDVVKVVRYAAEHRFPIVPFGTGTGLEGHVVPVSGGISLDMTRMNRILEVRPDDFLARVQPGVTKIQLNETLRHYGLFFAVDPGADASLGGMAATGASGTTTVRFGAMKDNVRSLEVVLPDGQVIHTASLAAKSSSGYNVTPLFVGSEGTLGVITELWVRLHGLPEKIIAARARFADFASCVRTATALVGAGIPVVRLELVSQEFVAAFNRYRNLNDPVVPTLLLEFWGHERGVESDVGMAEGIAREEGCLAFDFVAGEQERQDLWDLRHHALYAFMHQFPGCRHMSTDVCVPLSKLPEAVEFAQQRLKETGVRGAIIGHVGDGNFHVAIAIDMKDSEDVNRAHRFNEELVYRALALGGTCTGEHGVGLGKMKYQEMEHGAALQFMRLIKRTVDPQGIMNPGKLVDVQ